MQHRTVVKKSLTAPVSQADAGPFDFAQGRLFDSARLSPHFAQDDRT